MKLRDLEAKLYRCTEPGSDRSLTPVDRVSDAQCVMFLCPKCFAEKGSKVGVHSVMCWFHAPGVKPEWTPNPGRWNPSGTSIDDLTFVGPGAFSVQLPSGEGQCGWHGFVKDGDAT